MLGLAVLLWLRLHDLRFEDLLIAVHGDSGITVRVCCLSRVMALSQLDLITEPWGGVDETYILSATRGYGHGLDLIEPVMLCLS